MNRDGMDRGFALRRLNCDATVLDQMRRPEVRKSVLLFFDFLAARGYCTEAGLVMRHLQDRPSAPPFMAFAEDAPPLPGPTH